MSRSSGAPRGIALVVDDDLAACEVLSDGLTHRGFEVVYRTTLSDAVAFFESSAPCDVVLTDLRLRGASGLDVAARARALRPHLPCVVITAFGSIEAALEAIRAGAYDFITKPFEIDAVALTLDRAVQRHRLERELEALRRGDQEAPFAEMIGESPAMRRVFDLVTRVADSESTVLITGESGTGKELVARALHARSTRASAPFVALNCAAIPETLLESELFGHVRGAYTDAKSDRVGLFVRAGAGTLFLDEIADLPMAMQAKLLRAVQERRVRPVGSDREIAFEARLVAATHKDLEAEVAAGRFRQDLFFRIHVIEVALPPLRARGNDVLALAHAFVERHGALARRPARLSTEAASALSRYEWPGNVRELENTIERAVALCRDETITLDDLPERMRRPEAPAVLIRADELGEIVPMEEMERRYVLRVMTLVHGNKTLAAQMLGMDRSTLYRKLERWNASES
ncbi:MAG: sigma-54 dependent transcriptional regulator [Sandaracinus sp.]